MTKAGPLSGSPERRSSRALERLLLAVEGGLMVVVAVTMLYNRLIFSDASVAHYLDTAGYVATSAQAGIVGMFQRTSVWPLHYMASILLSILMAWHAFYRLRNGGGTVYVALAFFSTLSILGGAVLFTVESEVLKGVHYVCVASLVGIYVYLAGRLQGGDAW